MLPPDQDGSARARFESEFELRLPARRLGLYLSHPLKEEDRERVEGAHELRPSGVTNQLHHYVFQTQCRFYRTPPSGRYCTLMSNPFENMHQYCTNRGAKRFSGRGASRGESLENAPLAFN
jgi:hypothetical protein